MAADYRPKNYLPYIDGLRGLAVLLVVLFHLDIALIKGGFIGVDIFFVISGFLITKIIVKEMKEKRFSFVGFYSRRIKRIFPALFVMLLFTSLAAIIFFGPEQFSYHFKSLRLASAQVSNIFFMQDMDYFDAANKSSAALLHTWSLGVEEQFYIIWPVLLLLIFKLGNIKRGYIALVGIVLISLILSEYLVRFDAMQAFYMLHSRAWELAVGGIVALNVLPSLNKRMMVEISSALGFVAIIFAALAFDVSNFPGVKAIFPCFGSALIIYSAQSREGFVHKGLSLCPVIFIGLISYSVYLWHWPLIIFYKSYFSADLSLMAQAIIAFLSCLFGFLSYRYVEQPFRRGKFSPLYTVIVGISMILVFIVGSNVIKKHSEAGWRVTYNLNPSITDPNKWVKSCASEGGAYDDDCIIGSNKNSYEVMLVGDSHASHFIPMVLGWAEQRGLTVRLFMRGACRTWYDSDEVRIKNGKIDSYCTKLSKDFFQILEKPNNVEYLFLAQRLPQGIEVERTSLERIKSYNKKTYFLGAVAEFEEHPHECNIKNNLLITKIIPKQKSKDHCLEFDPSYVEEKLASTRTGFVPLLASLGIPYFDPTQYIIQPFDQDDRFMYMDTNHLNEHGSMFLLPHLQKFVMGGI